MATVRPFAAIRPAKHIADQMIALPYDVMNREEASKMAGDNPYSFLHISRGEIDLSEIADPYDPQVYQHSADTIKDWLARGILLKDPKPMLYLYRQTMDGRIQTGYVGCVSIDEYQNEIIKKHEFTRVEKELDRIRHFDVCDANTEPVFLTYRDDDTLRAISSEILSGSDPEVDVTTPDGIRHELWIVDSENAISRICERFAFIPALYIADGHHRSASAAKVGMLRRNEAPEYDGSEEFNYFMAVMFPDSDLNIFDYNRVVKDLNGMTTEEFLSRLTLDFSVEEIKTGQRRPEQKHDISMYVDGKWYKLTAKEAIQSDDAILGLDVSILQDRILSPLLNINDPRTDKRIDFVGGIRGLDELERRVEGDMALAFALYPVGIEDLLKVADQGMVMPPKSTWFEPKLASGLFLHSLSRE
jgi:uncharacterized protein (DUF1015 family)